MLDAIKQAIGLDAPGQGGPDVDTEIERLERQHKSLCGERQRILALLHSSPQASSPPRLAEIEVQVAELNTKLDAARARKLKANAVAAERTQAQSVRDAAERGRLAAKAKPPSDGDLQTARKALAAAQTSDTKAQQESTAATGAASVAAAAAAERKRAYEAAPGDDAWAAYETARSKSERSSIDASVAASRAEITAAALAKAERAAAVADYNYQLARFTAPVDDALAAEAIAIVDRAAAWFLNVRERQRRAHIEQCALFDRARSLGLDVPAFSPELTAHAYGLAQVATELWAAAAHARGDSPAESTTASADATAFDAIFALAAPPGTNTCGGTHGPERARVRFDLATVERAARALAR